MEHWNYGRASQQQQAHSQSGQLGYPPVSFGGQQGAAAAATTPYGSQLLSFGQAYGQQILGGGGKTDEFPGTAAGSAGLGGGSAVNMSGIYGLDSKFANSGYGVMGASPAAFNQKTDQLSGLGQYSKNQSSFLSADGGDALKRYSESQLLQTALRQGAGQSVLDGGIRSQSDFLSSGRNSAIASAGGGAYGVGRELLGGGYGVTRSEAEAALLGTPVGLTARSGVGVLPFQSQAADSLGSLAGGRGILGSMYAPGSGYSALDLGSARSAISGMSDLAGIGGPRYDDRLDDRIALRFEYDRREDERRVRERSRERDRDRERERERSWERERERERERLKERERARERERLRDRERARERDRDRERELRRREKTPPRLLPPPRRDEKAGKKFSPPRFSSPLKTRKREYLCKVEPFSLTERERDLLSLIRRYPRLYVSADFSKVVVCWKRDGLEIALNQPISFEHDPVDTEQESEAKGAVAISAEEADFSKEDIVWTVKVMLMSGASAASMKDLLADCNEEKPPHIHNFLRFVILRKERSALMASGGTWDKILDGGDPAADESALIRTAIRSSKDNFQLDLGGVTSWKRFMEVHYDRVRDNNTTYKEITVFFIPDLSGCLPTLENWKLQWKQRREVRLKLEASQKQETDGKAGGLPKDIQKKEKSEKKEDKDLKEDQKEQKKEEKPERTTEKDARKEKDTNEEKKDAKKEEKKEKDVKKEDAKKEEKKEKDVRKEEKKDKDVKKDDKDLKKDDQKKKDVKQDDKKEKDVKKEDKKQDLKKDKKGKVDKKDEEKKAGKKDDKDAKSSKGKTSDKKGKVSSEEEAPDLPGLFITSKRNKSEKARAMTISLDGLLDYDERDKEEGTFELSLFAEVFQEMLQHRFGSSLLEAFESLHHVSVARKKEEKKRVRQEKETKAVSKKKSKFSDNATPVSNTDAAPDKVQQQVVGQDKKDEVRPVKDIDAAMQEASLINFDELEEELQETPEVLDANAADEEDSAQEASEVKQADRKVVIDEELLKAFRYFDRNRTGFLKAEDVRRLVHILGRFLTRRWVKDLTASALSESKSKDDCIHYQKLVEKEIV